MFTTCTVISKQNEQVKYIKRMRARKKEVAVIYAATRLMTYNEKRQEKNTL